MKEFQKTIIKKTKYSKSYKAFLLCICLNVFSIPNYAQMEYKWQSDDIYFDMLESQTIKKLEQGTFCLSEDFQYCIALRIHDSWETDKGWRDSNNPPSKNDEGRLVLNFYHFNKENDEKTWFKMFVPLKYSNCSVKSLGQKYSIYAGSRIVIGRFDNFESLMWEFITGNAESEIEIEEKFNKLNKE